MFEKYLGIISEILGIIIALMTIWSGITEHIFVFLLGILSTLIIVCIFIKIKSYPKYTEIKGIRIEEADNIPQFVPRKNKMNPFRVKHICEIRNADAILEYQYDGVCTDKSGMDCFSTSLYAHDITELEEMNWFAYDLSHNNEKKIKIRPQLQTPKGSTKRVIFNFNKKIRYNEYCSYYTYQEVKNSIKEHGWDYYVSTVLYKNIPLQDYTVILKFHDAKPDEIEVYSVTQKKCSFLYKLTETDMEVRDGVYIYTDNIENETAWSIRVYLFHRIDD